MVLKFDPTREARNLAAKFCMQSPQSPSIRANTHATMVYHISKIPVIITMGQRKVTVVVFPRKNKTNCGKEKIL